MMKRAKKELDRICRFCVHARSLLCDAEMLCTKRGIVVSDYRCRHFSYDVLKRDPGPSPRPAPMEFVDIDE